MKKLLLFFTVCAVMIFMWAVSAAEEPYLTLDATKDESKMVLTISISEDSSICGCSFNLLYDNSTLEFLEYEKGTAVSNTSFLVNETFSEDSIRVTWASVSELKDGGVVLRMVFSIKDLQKESVDFTLDKLKMVDVNSSRIACDCNDISVRILEQCDETTTVTEATTSNSFSGSTSSKNPSKPAVTTTTDTIEEPKENDPEVYLLKFEDVDQDAWYFAAVRKIVEIGLFAGTSENEFSPDAEMTRAMLVTVLHRLDGTPKVENAATFRDVAAGQWYSDAVAWASESGLVKGYTENAFGTGDSITRQDMVTILYRYLQYKGMVPDGAKEIADFADAGEVSAYALDAVQWSYGTGLVKGTSERALSPGAKTTRAQVATIILRYIENISE